MDRRTLASRSQEVDRLHDEGVFKPATRFSRYNTAPEVDQDLYRAIWKALSSIDGSLVGEGRVYGGGLHKLEPKELANVTADFILTALPLAREIRQHRQRVLGESG
jgi:hypothetical protein